MNDTNEPVTEKAQILNSSLKYVLLFQVFCDFALLIPYKLTIT